MLRQRRESKRRRRLEVELRREGSTMSLNLRGDLLGEQETVALQNAVFQVIGSSAGKAILDLAEVGSRLLGSLPNSCSTSGAEDEQR